MLIVPVALGKRPTAAHHHHHHLDPTGTRCFNGLSMKTLTMTHSSCRCAEARANMTEEHIHHSQQRTALRKMVIGIIPWQTGIVPHMPRPVIPAHHLSSLILGDTPIIHLVHLLASMQDMDHPLILMDHTTRCMFLVLCDLPTDDPRPPHRALAQPTSLLHPITGHLSAATIRRKTLFVNDPAPLMAKAPLVKALLAISKRSHPPHLNIQRHSSTHPSTHHRLLQLRQGKVASRLEVAAREDILLTPRGNRQRRKESPEAAKCQKLRLLQIMWVMMSKVPSLSPSPRE